MKANRSVCLWVLSASAAALPGLVQAQYGGGGGGGGAAPPSTGASAPTRGGPDLAASPLIDGGYAAVLGTYQKTLQDEILSNNYGGSLLLGYRAHFYALETGLAYTSGSSSAGGSGIQRQSFKFKALIFPFESLPMAYGVIGAGMTRMVNYPVMQPPIGISSNKNTYTADIAGGLGYMVPLHLGSYQFALRAEGLYQLGDRFLQRQSDFTRDIPIPSTYKDVAVNVGLQLPLRFPQPVAAAPAEAVAVTPPTDTDGDGVIDDTDKCPGTPAGVKVDASGCALPPPCKTPEEGEKLDLSGCGTGDVIVLRGVNFEFNQSRLTVNAKTILDDVATALLSQSGLHIELGGHTDGRGSAPYNQKLSEARAGSVMKYLAEKGVHADHLSAVGYGASQPVADNETDEGRELNRRVQLKIVSQDDAPLATTDAATTAPAADVAVAPADAAIPPADIPEAPASSTETVPASPEPVTAQ